MIKEKQNDFKSINKHVHTFNVDNKQRVIFYGVCETHT